jgi:hypothetical protein
MTLQAKANTGAGTDNLATDLVAGEHIGLSKLVTGALGVNGGPVSPSNPLPTFTPAGLGVGALATTPAFVTPVDAAGAPLVSGGLLRAAIDASTLTPATPLATQLSQGNAVVSSSNPVPVGLSIAGAAPSGTNTLPVTIRDNLGANVAVAGKVNVNVSSQDVALNVAHQQGGAALSATNPSFTTLSKAGALVSTANALDTQLAVAGAVVSATNPLAAQLSLGNAPISLTNPQPSVSTKGGAVTSATNPNDVAIRDNLGANVAVAGKVNVNVSSQDVALNVAHQQGGAALSATNPSFTTLSKAGALVSTANALDTQLAVAGAVVSATNPLAAQLSLGNLPLDDNNSLPVRNAAKPVLTTTALSAIDTNIMNGVTPAASSWVDTKGASELIIQVSTTVGLTAGSVLIEGSNDATAALGTALSYDEPNLPGTRGAVVAMNFTSASTRIFRVPLSTRFIRVRITTAFASGTVGAISYFRESPYTAAQSTQATTVTNSVSVVNTVSSSTVVGSVVDASAARTVSATGATGTNTGGRGGFVMTNITAVSGTTPTLTMALQIQDPVSLTFQTIYTFPVRTAVGLYITQIQPGLTTATDIINGGVPRVFRFSWTIGGTTPSFTFSNGFLPV